MKIYSNSAQIIGNTPLIRLSNLEKEYDLKASLLAKAEFFNPTGSAKDRAAKFMVDDGLKRGVISQGATIIEPTSGNTGIGLAAYAVPKGFRVIITTNGTLLKSRRDILLSHADIIHKVSVSLHAPEGNSIYALDEYLTEAVSFAKAASESGIFTVFRLWNEDSADAAGRNLSNPKIEEFLYSSFEGPYIRRPRGIRLAKYIFLEHGDTFVWPIESEADEREALYCHALSDQAAILADGSVVPCCLDSEGVMTLGNIFESSLTEILDGERAVKIKKGFGKGCAEESLCKKCSYARRFSV